MGGAPGGPEENYEHAHASATMSAAVLAAADALPPPDDTPPQSPAGGVPGPSAAPEETPTLHVGGIGSPGTEHLEDEGALEQLFGQFGAIVAVTRRRDAKGIFIEVYAPPPRPSRPTPLVPHGGRTCVCGRTIDAGVSGFVALLPVSIQILAAMLGAVSPSM